MYTHHSFSYNMLYDHQKKSNATRESWVKRISKGQAKISSHASAPPGYLDRIFGHSDEDFNWRRVNAYRKLWKITTFHGNTYSGWWFHPIPKIWVRLDNHPKYMEKCSKAPTSIICMAIFNSYVKLPEGANLSTNTLWFTPPRLKKHTNTMAGWWLSHPSEIYEFVNWDDDIPKYGKIKVMFKSPPTSIVGYSECVLYSYNI